MFRSLALMKIIVFRCMSCAGGCEMSSYLRMSEIGSERREAGNRGVVRVPTVERKRANREGERRGRKLRICKRAGLRR